MKFSIQTYYFNLTRAQQVQFRKMVITTLGINYGNFYAWITRDTIPEKHKENFATKVLEKPVEEIFPELIAA